MKDLYALVLVAAAVIFPSHALHAQCPGSITGNTVLPLNSTTVPQWSPSTIPTLVPPYTFNATYATSGGGNVPPTGPGASGQPPSCDVCPSLFVRENLCANHVVPMWMCLGNIYTITLCGSPLPVNTMITILNTTYGTVYEFDDDGCGVVNGLSTVEFAPQISAQYRIRVTTPNTVAPPCDPNPALCFTMEISCSPVPPPPPNDEPCAAIPIPVGTLCNFQPSTNAWATAGAGVPVPFNCNPSGVGGSGSYFGYDVWYSAVVPASGNLSLQVQHNSATNLAMAVYTAPGCAGPFTQVDCNSDVVVGNLEPFLTMSGLAPGSVVFVRVWSESSLQNAGTFGICAYEPVPPPNDNPCGAIPLPVNPACTPSTYTTESATNLASNMTATPAPTCGALVGGDVWFSVLMPASGSMTVSSLSGALTDMSMAIYSLTSGSLCGPGTLTQLAGACNDNSPLGGTMPRLTITGTPGTTYYVRMWSTTAAFGTFQMCAFENFPPPNDNPCGALPLVVNYGCLLSSYSNENGTVTGNTALGTATSGVPNPSCGGTPNSDVWFTAVVPPNGVLQFDTDDGLLTDAAMAVYTATGSCASNTLNLTQVGCATGGSPQGALMPVLSVSGLPAGQTVYVRVWRQGGGDGNFSLCARRTDPAPGNCNYTLSMYDSAGDGWNGSTVQICVGGVCTNYTINGATGTVTFGANVGQLVTVVYTAAGGFQNQISYTLTTPNSALLYGSGTTPATGLVFNFNVNTACNVPPAPPSDCIGAFEICNSQQFTGNPSGVGGVLDLNSSNDGCLSGEHQGLWFTWTVTTTGTMAFSIDPTSPTYTDYDFAVWGPFTSGITCPPNTAPYRCSFAAGGSTTGLNFTSTDVTEGAGGNSWVRWMDVVEGQQYLLYVDNWSQNGISFDFDWNASNTANVDCVVLPVTWLGFEAIGRQRQVDLAWSTASEVNSSHFEVERSTDGRNFAVLGHVPARGESMGLAEYAFVDVAPVKGTNYYRLRQVDLDGAFTYSTVADVLFAGASARIVLYPNPADESLFAVLDLPGGSEGPLTYRILDATGRIADQGRSTVQGGTGRVAIPLNRVEAGSYILELRDAFGMDLGNARFIKQ